jgi:hypothetical protein
VKYRQHVALNFLRALTSAGMLATIAACSSVGNMASMPSNSQSSQNERRAQSTCADSGTCNPNCPGQVDSCSSAGQGGPEGGGGGGTPEQPKPVGPILNAPVLPKAPPNKACNSTNSSNAAANTKARDAAASNAIAVAVNANPSLINTMTLQEAVGYVYSNGSGAFSWDSVGPVTLGSENTASLPPPHSYTGWTAVGIWHTHPLSSGNPTQVDDTTMNMFSVADESTVTGSIVSMYVGVDATTQVSPSNAQEMWFAYSPTSLQSGKPGTGQSIGSGGC